MNVVLQSLIATPPFFNLLAAVGRDKDMCTSLGEDSLLRSFVELSKYFDPNEQIDRNSGYNIKVVDGEKILGVLLNNFNPH